MIQIGLDMDMPEECHKCPFQFKFKDDEIDSWYMRRCVITRRKIEYPRPEWCPLKEREPVKPTWLQGKAYCSSCGHGFPRKSADREINYCSYCGRAVKWIE